MSDDPITAHEVFVPAESRYPEGAVTVSEVTEDGIVRFNPMHGGWNCSLATSDFHKAFRRVSNDEMAAPGYRAGLFDIEDYFQPPLPGYTQGFLWNGWAVPCFEFDQVTRINEVLGDLTYDKDKDAFLFYGDYPDEEPEAFTGQDIVVDGETKRVYPVGAGFWCWSQEPDASD